MAKDFNGLRPAKTDRSRPSIKFKPTLYVTDYRYLDSQRRETLTWPNGSIGSVL